MVTTKKTAKKMTKMTGKEKIFLGTTVVLVVAFIAAIVGIINISQENRKLEAIIDMACNYSGDVTSCKRGIKMLKGMSTEDIENLGYSKYSY